MNNNDKGFTIVELVVVIIVISILAVTAIPRLTVTESFSATTDRDQLIALLISVQTRAMQNTEFVFDFTGNIVSEKCHTVAFTTDEIGMLAQRSNGLCSTGFAASDDVDDFLKFMPENDFTVRNLANATVSQIGFNNLGQPVPQTAYKITFDSSASLCIESEGYIHVCQ